MRARKTTPLRAAVFRSIHAAQRAIRELEKAGFPLDHVSVVCPDKWQDRLPDEVNQESEAGSHTPTAAATGGAAGALLGGLTAVAGVTTTGGAGLLAVGPILGLTGGGALAGSFLGVMATRGMEPEVADFYDQALDRGDILVAVDTEEGDATPNAEEAERIFESCGAEPIPLSRD